MSGQLPVTRTGHRSYSLAKSVARERLDTEILNVMAEYGLTCLEIADILADQTKAYVRVAVDQEQRLARNREGVIGTPREGDDPPDLVLQEVAITADGWCAAHHCLPAECSHRTHVHTVRCLESLWERVQARAAAEGMDTNAGVTAALEQWADESHP